MPFQFDASFPYVAFRIQIPFNASCLNCPTKVIVNLATAMKTVYSTEIKGVPAPKRGKVRDVYPAGQNTLLIVATDRVSAFDVILPDAIPGKGKLLTQISLFWFKVMEDLVENHLISARVPDFPAPFNRYGELLEGRSILVKKANVVPIEAIVRGYLSGSGWKSYRKTGTVCGIKLPDGLLESSALHPPLFTPSTKAQEGHDINISFEEAKEIAGAQVAEKIKELSLKIYEKARLLALEKGIIIADTKMEFGLVGDKIILVDELLTPDSSRFWSQQGYREGAGQDSYDKQIIRDALIETGWDMTPPAPPLPPEVLEKASKRYQEIHRLLAG